MSLAATNKAIAVVPRPGAKKETAMHNGVLRKQPQPYPVNNSPAGYIPT
jgi:hypothetical protein